MSGGLGARQRRHEQRAITRDCAALGLQWRPAPLGAYWTEGKRWMLVRNGVERGRVVQLLPRGLWEATWTGFHSFYSPGHATLREAALALLKHLEEHECTS